MFRAKWVAVYLAVIVLLGGFGYALAQPGWWVWLPAVNKHCSVWTAVTATPTATAAATKTPTPAATCTAYSACLALTSLDAQVQVGDVLTVTARLTNQGCGMIGLPLYRLRWEDEAPSHLEALAPLEVLHYRGLYEGETDEAAFVLRGLSEGQAVLSGHASFEVHLGYPGPAFWGGASSLPLMMAVVPAGSTPRQPVPTMGGQSLFTTIAEFAPDDAETGVGLALQDASGRYLFFLAGSRHRCSPGELFYAGIGGHREAGEGWTTCAHREAREEIGTDIKIVAAASTWLVSHHGLVQRVELRDRPRPLALVEMIHPATSPRAGELYRIVVFRASLRGEPKQLAPEEVQGIIALTVSQVVRGIRERPTLLELLTHSAELVAGHERVDKQVRVYPLGTARALAFLLDDVDVGLTDDCAHNAGNGGILGGRGAGVQGAGLRCLGGTCLPARPDGEHSLSGTGGRS